MGQVRGVSSSADADQRCAFRLLLAAAVPKLLPLWPPPSFSGSDRISTLSLIICL